MKLRLIALALGATLAFNASAVDSVVVGYSPRTGDAFIDTRLGDVNVFARGNTDGFIDDIVVSYGAPRSLVRELYYDRRWVPSDIYYACLLASILKRPCGYVVDIYERDRGQGWGVIAKRLGIKPGSREFHALKNGVDGGYTRMQGKAKAKGGKPGKPDSAGPGNSGKGGKPDDAGKGKGGKGNGKGNGKG